jgi:hypothetical protein
MSEAAEATRFRSPPFPSIPLQRAIERADQLFRQERDHLVPLSSAARAWGMSPTSSGPIQTVGALKQFNLLEDEGGGATRRVRLTRDALRLVLDKQANSPERMAAIQRCFFSAKIFSELWAEWADNLPSEQTMINHLVLERRLKHLAPFSEQAAVELLGNYRASLAFAVPQEDHNASPVSDTTEGDGQMQPDLANPRRAATGAVLPQRPSVYPVKSAPGDDSRERVVFTEEGEPRQYVKIVVSGELDEIMLDALSDYISRQKRRLKRAVPTADGAQGAPPDPHQ